VAGFVLGRGMKYIKPALSFEQQAQLLIDRGLIVPDKKTLEEFLRNINYYRLSAYWYPFKQVDPITGNERFKPNTRLETIIRRYNFDRQLRLLMMDAIEHIEVGILRTRMVTQFTLAHGPFGYCDPKNFNPNFPPTDYSFLLKKIDQAVDLSKEEFITHYKSKYFDEPHLPLWIIVEVMSFGQLYTFFSYLHYQEKKTLSNQFGISSTVFDSWIHTLNFIRNACAHHSRLWNREIPVPPKLPKGNNPMDWYGPTNYDNRRIFSVLTIMRYLLNFIDPLCSNWQSQLEQLLAEYPEIYIKLMGFPINWHECPIWK
jgi:abortive infection bacteriophage resistance protein